MADDLLWEIIDLLDSGEIVYLHRETLDLLSHPDPKRWDDTEARELLIDVQNRVELQPDAYVTLAPPEPKEAFYMMEAFIATVDDVELKNRFTDALRSKKPFRYFRTAVEETPLYDAWLDFKDAWMKVWLTDKLGSDFPELANE